MGVREKLRKATRNYIKNQRDILERVEELNPRQVDVVEPPLIDYTKGTLASLRYGSDEDNPGYVLSGQDSKEVVFSSGIMANLIDESSIDRRKHFTVEAELGKIRELEYPSWLKAAKKEALDPRSMDPENKRPLNIKLDIIQSMYISIPITRLLIKINKGRENKPIGYDFLSRTKPKEFNMWTENFKKFLDEISN